MIEIIDHRPPYDSIKPKLIGKIRLLQFKNFCPYSVNLDYYKDAMKNFSVAERIDLILGEVVYNSVDYLTEENKMIMFTRLLHFVEKRLNLIELAPKGTGKSYLLAESVAMVGNLQAAL